jgi:hypothetical protein
MAAPTNKQTIALPASKTVTVKVTSESCDYLQKTVILWPSGKQDTCETNKGNQPKTGTITYGSFTYTTGPAASQATVEVFEKDPNQSGATWKPTRTRLSGTQVVLSEGHPGSNPPSTDEDWNDTIVTFS